MRLGHLVAVLLAIAAPASALQIPAQRGEPCAAQWDVGVAQVAAPDDRVQPWDVLCVEGDPRCDRDGLRNDRCEIRIAACAGIGPTCALDVRLRNQLTPRTRAALKDGGVPGRHPGCGWEEGTLSLSLGRTSRTLTMKGRWDGRPGRSRIRVRCLTREECPNCCGALWCRRAAPGLPRQTKPCFPTNSDSGMRIARLGVAVAPSPAWPSLDYPKSAAGAVLSGTFCLSKTGDSSVDILTGLPGPAALLLPIDLSIEAQP